MKGKILVVDDEAKIVELVRLYLEKDGYQVVEAVDGKSALQQARREKPDLVVLDLNLPEIDGLEVCRQLRAESNVPIIMLTARVEDVDRIVGLELGADDYIPKPFSPREVVARVHAVLRRAAPTPTPDKRTFGELTVDPTRHEARLGSQELSLTPTEFKLLEVISRQPGRVFTRLQLVDEVLGEAYEGYDRSIDAHIKNLRHKIEADPQQPRYILTVYGVGYKFQESPGE